MASNSPNQKRWDALNVFIEADERFQAELRVNGCAQSDSSNWTPLIIIYWRRRCAAWKNYRAVAGFKPEDNE